MRTFKAFNKEGGYQCPICGKDTVEETILIPIAGTEEGNNMQACQVHTSCLQEQLIYAPPPTGLKSLDAGYILAGCKYPYRNETAEETKDSGEGDSQGE